MRLGVEIVEQAREDPRYGHTGDVVITRGDEVVFTHHAEGDRLRPIFSITKTLTSLLVGIAIDRGLVAEATEDVVEQPDVTLHHLLSMQRGAVCSFEDIDRLRELPAPWPPAILAMQHDLPPGTEFRYDNCGFELVGYWLAHQCGHTLEDLAAQHLFGPLGISQWRWPTDPEGNSWGSDGVWLRAQDLAAVGQLISRNGLVRGQRVVSSNWIRRMCRPRSLGGPPEELPYGYGVWVAPDRVLLGGWAGQHVSVFPEHDVTVVTTGDPDLLQPDWLPGRHMLEQRWPLGGPLSPAT